MDMCILPKTNKASAYEYTAVSSRAKQDISAKPSIFPSAAVLAIGSAGTVLMFSKGVQKASGKYLNKAKDFFEKKLDSSSLSGDNKKKVYEVFIRRFNSFVKKSESINNIISVKDILFMKFMYAVKPTKNIHKSITNYFENLSRKTISKTYQKAGSDFDKMCKIFDNLDKQIIEKSPDEIIEYKGGNYTKRQLAEMAKGYRETARVAVNAFVSEEAQQARFEHIKNATSSLYNKFWDASFKDFWSKNNKFKRKEMWQTFVAAEQVKGDKADLAEKIAIVKNVISYSQEDKINFVLENIKNLEDIIPDTANKEYEIIEKLKWFMQNLEVYNKNKDVFFKELDKLENCSVIKTSEESIINAHKNNIKSYIDIIKNTLNDETTGELEDMMDIYYKISPFEISKTGAAASLKKVVSSFDNAVKLETVEFFDKERDLVLGSAPTDVLTILFSGGAITYGLSFAKDRDKKISIMLKSGIPVIGAIAATMISATKLVSGTKSIVFGVISGIILNTLGNLADRYRLIYKEKRQA